VALLLLLPAVAGAASGVIKGAVTHAKTKKKVPDALVILQCGCLQKPLEDMTDKNGHYVFSNLPPGTYTVQVARGKGKTSKTFSLERNETLNANFLIDPEDAIVRDIVVPTKLTNRPGGGEEFDIDLEHRMPVNTDSGGGWVNAIEPTPTAGRDGAGIRMGANTGAESRYSLEGGTVTSPRFGTPATTVVQEFIESVEVQESGYEAEYGGAAGGIVEARRISGSNKFRGQALFRYTPRLAKPRVITTTDDALRVVQIPDYQLQAVATLTGPIVKDRLFFSAAIFPMFVRNSLIQSFYHRVDRNGSGGYEECPYENGAGDCVDGGNYIATERFAQQKFPTRMTTVGYGAGLDWIVTDKHRLRLTVTGGPSWVRTSHRLPFSFDPNAFGTNPSADPLSGEALMASGIVNGHFGTSTGNDTLVALGYEGRAAKDTLEIDAGLSYFQTRTRDAWKLDNPELKSLPATQSQDAQGANLYQLLDQDQALPLVPGAEQMCNSADLPGLACPVRRWVSGGLGEHDDVSVRRVEGRLALTNFFNAAGSHQLKYGTHIEHLEDHTILRYSGHNAADFENNCPPGQKGGGEWCYDPETDEYAVNNANRVDNHRFIIVDTDNPDLRTTYGFGRPRIEQGDLRAIATARGAGARVAAYDQTTSTQNYAAFLQDRWAVRNNLFLHGGVRWEIQDMRDILGRRAMLIWDNVAPRVGLVYDWTEEGRSRAYASYGWFFQPLPLQLNNRVYGGLIQVAGGYRNSDCVGHTTTANGQVNPRMRDGQPTEWCADPGRSTTGLTTGATVPHLRGMYDEKLQVGYEHEVIEDLILGVSWRHQNLGRAVEDVSTNGGQSFIVANPGVPVDGEDIAAKEARCEDLQADYDALLAQDPDAAGADALIRELNHCRFLVDAYRRINTMFNPPTRTFDAWTLEVTKRFAHNWMLRASYTYSRLVGNYDGFVDRDSGAINIGASTQYDIPEIVRNSFGPLSYDQPHRIKLDGFYMFNLEEAGRLTLGSSFRFSSGYPISVMASTGRYPAGVYVLPRGSGGRIQPNYQWNVSLAYVYPLPKELELEAMVRIFNVTNAKAVLRVDEVYSFQNTRAIAGGDLADLKHAKIRNSSNPSSFFDRTIVAPQGNYGVEQRFQTPLAAQFELRLRF